MGRAYGSSSAFKGSAPASFLDWTNGAFCAFGNSLTNGDHGVPYTDYLSVYGPPVGVGGIIYTNSVPTTRVAVSGATSVDLLGYVSSVTAAYVAGRTNVLCAWELTNSIYYGRTARQAVDDFYALIAACKAAKSWKVAAMTAIPRYQALQATGGTVDDTKSAAFNAVIDAANALLRTEYAANGIDLLIDLRSGSSPYNFNSYTSTDFTSVVDGSGHALYYPENGPPYEYVHLVNFGYLEVAKIIDARLAFMPA